MNQINTKNRNLLVRIAWMYYEEKLTQNEIADILGISRIKVQRALALAKDEGIVKVTICDQLVECLDLEKKLMARYPDLSIARIVPKIEDESLLRQALGRAAVEVTKPIIKDHDVLAFGWGKTISTMADNFNRIRLPNTSVVSIIGGLGTESKEDAYSIISQISSGSSHKCHYLPAPAIVDSKETRDSLLQMPHIRETLDLAKRSKLVFVGIGQVSEETTFCELGLIDPSEMNMLKSMGAVGDICGRFFDANGEFIKTDFDDRVIGLTAKELLPLQVIGVAGGLHKVPSIKGALETGVLNGLVTDEITAGLLTEI